MKKYSLNDLYVVKPSCLMIKDTNKNENVFFSTPSDISLAIKDSDYYRDVFIPRNYIKENELETSQYYENVYYVGFIEGDIVTLMDCLWEIKGGEKELDLPLKEFIFDFQIQYTYEELNNVIEKIRQYYYINHDCYNNPKVKLFRK